MWSLLSVILFKFFLLQAEEAERLRRLMMGHQSVEVRPPEDLIQAGN